jgi:peptidoglycan/xylan/chitin deacetylase (PgdA/CDA1 family)
MRMKFADVAVAALVVSTLVTGCDNGSPTASTTGAATVRPAISIAPEPDTNVSGTTENTTTNTTGADTANAVSRVSTDERIPGEVPPVPTTHHPQHATRHLVPEIYRVPAGDVALTIDDGPSPYTMDIIRVLNQYHVHVTFFFVGENALRHPEAVRAALASGAMVENHSLTHPLLTDLSQVQQSEQIEQTQAILKKLGAHPTLFRPPYGAFNDDTEEVLVKDHLALTLWNRDPRDWHAATPDEVVRAVVGGNPSGGVFDLHDTEVTLKALPSIIQQLRARGLQFVVL